MFVQTKTVCDRLFCFSFWFWACEKKVVSVNILSYRPCGLVHFPLKFESRKILWFKFLWFFDVYMVSLWTLKLHQMWTFSKRARKPICTQVKSIFYEIDSMSSLKILLSYINCFDWLLYFRSITLQWLITVTSGVTTMTFRTLGIQ